MTDIVVITIPGEPTSKQRARFARRGSKMVAFTPTETRSAEQSVGYAFRAAAPGWTLDASHAFSVEATFYLGYFQRRDVDNMLKLVCDGLTGVAWADDSQVYDIAGHRRIDVDNPRTEVTIAITGDLEYPSKDCEHCGKRFRTYTSTVRVQRFCCRDCSLAWRRRRRTVECAHCGASFESHHATTLQTYCSVACKSSATRQRLTCVQCGGEYTLPRSLAAGQNALCSQECRATFWRAQRKSAAQGTCQSCGGPVSRREYIRCRACHTSDPIKRDLRRPA